MARVSKSEITLYDVSDGLNSRPIYLYTVTNSSTAPDSFTGTSTYTFSSDTLTGWTNPISGQVWSRAASSLAKGQYLWVRGVVASSSATSVTIAIGEWSTAVISSIGGADGSPGATGARGAGWWRYDAGASDLSGVDTTAEVEFFWDDLHTPDIAAVKDDRFIIATTHVSGTKAFIFNGTNWVAQANFLDGNLLVAGTVTANSMAAGSITAANGAIDSLAVKRLNLQVGSVSDYLVSSTTLTTAISTYDTWTDIGSNYSFTLPTDIRDMPSKIRYLVGVGNSSTQSPYTNTTDLQTFYISIRYRLYNVTQARYLYTTPERKTLNHTFGTGSYVYFVSGSTYSYSRAMLTNAFDQTSELLYVTEIPYGGTTDYMPGDTLRIEPQILKNRSAATVTIVPGGGTAAISLSVTATSATYELELFYR